MRFPSGGRRAERCIYGDPSSDTFRGKLVKGRPISERVLSEDRERVDGQVDGEAWGNSAVRGCASSR